MKNIQKRLLKFVEGNIQQHYHSLESKIQFLSSIVVVAEKFAVVSFSFLDFD